MSYRPFYSCVNPCKKMSCSGQPRPAWAGLTWPRLAWPCHSWPGPAQARKLAWPSMALAGPGWLRLANFNFLWLFTGLGRPRPVMGWLGWSGRIKAIMTGKCQGQPEQFSWVDDLSHFCYKSGQVRYGQLTVFGITAV